MKTFKIKRMGIPESAFQVELELKSFKQLVDKLDGGPVLESSEGYFFISENENTVYFALKKCENKGSRISHV